MKNASLTGLLTRKTTRSIKNNWGPFLSIILITAIAVTLFLGLSSNAESFKGRVDKLYEECNVADIWITTDSESDSDINYIKSLLASGDTLEKRGYMPATYQEDAAYMVTTEKMPTINSPYLVESSITEETEDFFIVDKALVGSDVSLTGTELGSSVNVSISTSLLGETAKALLGDTNLITMSFTVNGLMEYAENVSTSSYNSSTFFVSEHYFKSELKSAVSDIIGSNILDTIIDGYSLNNQMVIKLGKNTKSDTLMRSINSYYNGSSDATLVYLYDLENAPFNIVVQADVNQAVALSYVFSFLFFFVAMLVILTTMSQLITKERQDIGTLKAIGLSSQRIFSSYLILMLILVAIGFIIGTIIGPFLLPWIMDIKYSILYTLPAMTYTFPWVYFIVTAAVLIVLTAFVVYLACRSELRLTPSNSMRPPVVKALKPKKQKEEKKPRFLFLSMARRNIRLHKAKSVMVMVGIMGCTALLVVGYGIDDTLDHSIDYDISHFYDADVTLTYQTGTSSQLELLESYDEIDRVEEITSMSTTVLSENKDSTVMTDTTLYVLGSEHSFIDIDFAPNEIAISSKISKEANLDVGDTITFETVDATYTGTVGVVYKTFVFHGVIVSSDNPSFSSLANTVSTAYLNVVEGTDPEVFASELGDLSFVASTTTSEETYDYITSIVSSISYMTLAVKIFAILLAVVVLFNLTYLNFKDRVRQIATLKVTGFSTVDIAKTLIYESLILVLIGTLIGLAVGFPAEILVLVVNRNALVEFLYTVTAWTMCLSFIITMGAGIIVNFVLATRIRSVPMVESLKSVE